MFPLLFFETPEKCAGASLSGLTAPNPSINVAVSALLRPQSSQGSRASM